MMQVKLVNAHGVVLMLPEEMAVEGWPSEREIPGTEITGRHGRRVDLPIARLRARRVRISGTMAGIDQDEADAIRSHVAGFVHQANPIKVYRHANSDKYLLCSAEGVDHRYTVGRFGGRVFTMTLTMEAAEPFLLSDEVVVEQVISGVAGQAVRVEAEAPGEYEVKLGNLYSATSGWYVYESGAASGGKTVRTSTIDDYVEVVFYGSGISFITYADTGSRIVDVYIDGVLDAKDLNMVAPTSTWGFVGYSKSGLTAGKHTLKIVVVGGANIHLDAFDILPSSLLTLDNKGSTEADVQLLIEAQEKETHADFLGKVAGSTVANKHVAHSAASATNVLPTDSLTELETAEYTKLSAKDSTTSTVTTSTNGLVPQKRFAFSQLPALADLTKLRQHARELTLRYFGYGFGVNGGADNHEAEVLLHNRETNSWESQGYAGMSFSRDSAANLPDGTSVVANQPRYVDPLLDPLTVRFENDDKPWMFMKRCNLLDDGTVTAYYGDAGYKEDGSNGQVMVEIPKFYYMTVVDTINGQKTFKWHVSMLPMLNFKVHPAFIRNGVVKDTIYFSAYEGCVYDTSASAYLLADEQIADFDTDKLSSIAGAKPASGLEQNLTIVNSRKLAQNRGVGWEQQDFLTTSALQMLMFVELSAFDVQTKIGLGVVNKASGEGNEAENTGQTASLGNQSGMANGTNGLVSVSYRGVENFWGNIWTWVDGINISDNVPWVADHGFESDLFVAPYTSLGVKLASTNGYASDLATSSIYDYGFLPLETSASTSNTMRDYYYQALGIRVARLGGAWSHGGNAGAAYWTLHHSSASRLRDIGARLLYIPQGGVS